ncbi:hypothetical protein RUM43_000706 [Polyplax serrata]|uniref:Pyruvate kinase n=1 Tax=Polyplax serrata TaxID=468196 RepID=A0AAN8XP12_POLSC
MTENEGELYGEEIEGEAYVPDFVCIKNESIEEICESESVSCSEARTTTGNILHRLVKDPYNRRPPCLAKWPTYTSKSNFEENIHQYRAAQQPTPLTQMCSLRITSDPNTFRQPAIVGTIGPSSTSVQDIMELLEAGMNVARISMAHINQCNMVETFRNVLEASNRNTTLKDYNIPITVMMDLKGPEIRTGRIDPSRIKGDGPPQLLIKESSFVKLTTEQIFEEKCTDKVIYLNYPGLIKQIMRENPIYISDGQIKLRVDLIEANSVLCYVENGGILKNYQKVHIPMLPSLLPAISNYDLECLNLAVEMDVDVVVVPMTRNSEVIKQVKKTLGETDRGKTILVFAKISSYEGLENIDNILKVADGIVIQKDDLSLEILPEKVFIAQKQIIAKCNRVRKPVLCTAELSSSKTTNNATRRVEINDISNAIIDGADGIIVITETALGDDGVDIVSQLSKVLREAEATTMQTPYIADLSKELVPAIEPNSAVALAAVQISNKIQASAILTVTTSGKTAQQLSWFRPRRPVIAITRVGRVARQMNLWRAVLPLHYVAPVLQDWFQDVKARFEYGISYGRNQKIIESGDLLVLVSGYRKKSGFTNCIRIVFASVEVTNGITDNVSSYYSEASKESSNIA